MDIYMTNLVQAATLQLKELLENAVKAAIGNGSLPQAELPDFIIEVPADKTHGDFASNAAMVSARAFHLAPRKIAEIIVQHLSLDGSYFKSCEIAGPGFLNFFLSASWFSDVLNGIAADQDSYGRSSFGRNKKILVEFVSANPTGPDAYRECPRRRHRRRYCFCA